MVKTDRVLLRLHVEAVWGVRLAAIEQNEAELLHEGSQPSWKLCMADLADERIYIWRPDISKEEREAVRISANEAAALPSGAIVAPGMNREVVLHQIAPTIVDVATARTIACPLTLHDRPLVETFQSDSDDDYFHPERQPLVGVIVEGRLLSLAHSSRRTSEACELGIDTLPDARRKGYALAATVLWAEMVAQEGLVPIYSASADNNASLALAHAAGYRAFAWATTFEG